VDTSSSSAKRVKNELMIFFKIKEVFVMKKKEIKDDFTHTQYALPIDLQVHVKLNLLLSYDLF
jgi:hypothetical protein